MNGERTGARPPDDDATALTPSTGTTSGALVDHGTDAVDWTSEGSFPASDPPGWAGSGSVTHEAPPDGPQAAWSVEREVAPPTSVAPLAPDVNERDENGGGDR